MAMEAAALAWVTVSGYLSVPGKRRRQKPLAAKYSTA